MNLPDLANNNKQVYIIYCLDDLTDGFKEIDMNTKNDKLNNFNGSIKRMLVYEEHKSYQNECSTIESQHYIDKHIAGPLLCDEGINMIGSCFIVYATKNKAIEFYKNDPFFINHIWKKVFMLLIKTIYNYYSYICITFLYLYLYHLRF